MSEIIQNEVKEETYDKVKREIIFGVHEAPVRQDYFY
jgi:hypothetical protein